MPVPPALFDSHIHWDFPAFDADRPAVLARALAAGVAAMAVPGVRAADWPRLRATVAATAGAHACYGLHPCYCAEHSDADVSALADWAAREQPAAIGECGLDLSPAHRAGEARQRGVFEAQLAIARRCSLPVVLHARGAIDPVLKCLRLAGQTRGVLHSFAGSEQQARAALDQGLYIGLGTALTHPRARRLRRLAATLPGDAIVLESDAPDQPGAAHRGERNEPAWLVEVLAELAALRGEEPLALAAQCSANTRALYALAG